MRTKTIKMTTALLFTILLNAGGIAQQNQPQPQWVDFQGFKGRVFDIKHRDVQDLARVLNPLGSGFKGATIDASREFNTLTVRDFPENIAAIEEAIKRLDVPGAVRPAEAIIELKMHILLASNIEGASNQAPAELNDVIKQLQPTLSFKNYHHLTTIIQRAKEFDGRRQGGMAVTGDGTVQVVAPFVSNPQSANYSYRIQSLTVAAQNGGGTSVSLDPFTFELSGALGKARIDTRLPVRDGERVVVGTAGLNDKAMILVLSAKVVK